MAIWNTAWGIDIHCGEGGGGGAVLDVRLNPGTPPHRYLAEHVRIPRVIVYELLSAVAQIGVEWWDLKGGRIWFRRLQTSSFCMVMLLRLLRICFRNGCPEYKWGSYLCCTPG